MTQRSRVCAILFDVNSQAYESTARFWSETLGRAMEFDAQARYTALCGKIGYLIQNTDPGREGMHIDIETDDVEAEVSRLENLGAKQRNRVEDWVSC